MASASRIESPQSAYSKEATFPPTDSKVKSDVSPPSDTDSIFPPTATRIPEQGREEGPWDVGHRYAGSLAAGRVRACWRGRWEGSEDLREGERRDGRGLEGVGWRLGSWNVGVGLLRGWWSVGGRCGTELTKRVVGS